MSIYLSKIRPLINRENTQIRQLATYKYKYNIMNYIILLHQNRVDPEKLTTAIRYRWNVGPDDEKYEYLKNFTLTVANSDLYNLEGYEVFKDDPSLNVDLFKLAVEVGGFFYLFQNKRF